MAVGVLLRQEEAEPRVVIIRWSLDSKDYLCDTSLLVPPYVPTVTLALKLLRKRMLP